MNVHKSLFIALAGVCLPVIAQSPITTIDNTIATPLSGASSPGNASSILANLQISFSGGKPVTNVQLTGTAIWYADGPEDTGTATLTASSTGAAQLQLSLSKSGVRTELQDSIGPTMTCQWSYGSQTLQSADAMNCWKGEVWFLPALSLQAATLPVSVGVVDYGVDADSSGSFHHLQSQMVVPGLPGKMTAQVMQESTTDIGLDPVSLLPARLSYKVHPDDGAPIQVPIEVRFSNYQKIGGVEVPFLIRRYINGSLQLEVSVQSAEIN